VKNTVRGDIEARFRKLMNAERLIQANVRISLSAKLPSFVKDGGRKVRAFSDVFKIFARSFKQREQHFKLLMASQGGAIKALNNQEHYEEMLKFWSPRSSAPPHLQGSRLDAHGRRLVPLQRARSAARS
jgi:hypothetical protein